MNAAVSATSTLLREVLARTSKLKPEFEKRNTRVLALSVDDANDHRKWINDINETQNTAVDFPIIADKERKVSELYDFIHPNASATATVRSLLIIDPENYLVVNSV